MNKTIVAVVIPCYKVREHILGVISEIGPEADLIYVVDDCCPDKSGDYVSDNITDGRVKVIKNEANLGVGGAVLAGYKAALADGAEIIVKIDGDGQMDPALIKRFLQPIQSHKADYTKGNRFFDLENINAMPKRRIFGNAALSIITKLSSGYWNLFDPTNGYTAIHADIVRHLPFNKISNRYFFESDILFRLNILGAVVVDIPMDAKYGDEVSNLKISKIIREFFVKNIKNFLKRIFYNYYLRDMSLASIELPIGLLSFFFGVVFGSLHWVSSATHDQSTPTGTIIIAALFILMGFQLLLAFLSYDIASVPKQVKHELLRVG